MLYRARALAAMIGGCRDLAEIDRTLEQLGKVPEDVGALIARVLGAIRSPEALESALQALGRRVRGDCHAATLGAAHRHAAARRTCAPRAERTAALSSHDTMEQWQTDSLPAAPTAAALYSATEDSLGAPEPAPMFTFSGTPLAGAGVPMDDAPEPAPMFTFSAGTPLAGAGVDFDDEPELSLGAGSDAPPAQEDAPGLSTRELLDRELDPREFPSRPPLPRQTPAPAAAATPVEEDDFEMLIEDEEILEIQEDDVETDESDEP